MNTDPTFMEQQTEAAFKLSNEMQLKVNKLHRELLMEPKPENDAEMLHRLVAAIVCFQTTLSRSIMLAAPNLDAALAMLDHGAANMRVAIQEDWPMRDAALKMADMMKEANPNA